MNSNTEASSSAGEPASRQRAKFWDFIKDIGPILVGLAAVMGSIYSSNLDRAERNAERKNSEKKEAYDRRLEVARRMVGACLKIEDDGREVGDLAKQGANTEAEQAENRLSADIEEFDQAYGESVLLFDTSAVKQFTPVEKTVGDIDFPRTEDSKDLKDDARSFDDTLNDFFGQEQKLLTNLKAIFSDDSASTKA